MSKKNYKHLQMEKVQGFHIIVFQPTSISQWWSMYVWSGHTCPIRSIVCINLLKLNVNCVIFTRCKKSSSNTANVKPRKGNDGGKVPCQDSFTRKCQVWTEGGSKRPLCFKTIVQKKKQQRQKKNGKLVVVNHFLCVFCLIFADPS